MCVINSINCPVPIGYITTGVGRGGGNGSM